MFEELKESLMKCPIVKKGDYNYFVHPISDGVPAMEPKVLKEISESIKRHANLNVDKIVGVEAMGIHLATALSLETGIPFVVVRKRQYGLDGEREVIQKTGYGGSTLYINDLKERDKVLLIDDVVSTGGTLTSVLNALKDMGVEVVTTVAVLEKGEGKKIVEENTGCNILSLIKLDVIDGKMVIESTIED